MRSAAITYDQKRAVSESRRSSDSHAAGRAASASQSMSRVVLPKPAGAEMTVSLVREEAASASVSRRRGSTSGRSRGTRSFVSTSRIGPEPPTFMVLFASRAQPGGGSALPACRAVGGSPLADGRPRWTDGGPGYRTLGTAPARSQLLTPRFGNRCRRFARPGRSLASKVVPMVRRSAPGPPFEETSGRIEPGAVSPCLGRCAG